jgi:fatty-acyl-CoA synthase
VGGPNETLADALAGRAATDAGAVAYDDGKRSVTFGELAELAAGRAAALEALGVRHGDHVAIVMSSGVPLVEVFWGAQLLGAVACVLNPGGPPAGLTRRVELVRPRVVVTNESAEQMPRAGAPKSDPEVAPDDLAFLQTTSGTSGVPRAVMIRHRNVLAWLRASHGVGEIARGDVLVAWVPPWHDLGLVRFVIGAVYYGAACHMVQPAIRTLPDWLRRISDVGGTVSGAPDFCYRLAARVVDPDSIDLSSLRFTTNGGEPVRRSSIEEFEARFGVRNVVTPGYGLAEATLGVSAQLAGEPLTVDERGNVACGRPLPGLEVRAGTSWEEPDEVLVRGDAVAAGYLDAPEETSWLIRDGWLHTGDSGYLDEAGRLFILGRRAGMIKRGGATIAPRELEEAAQRVPGVGVAAAVSIEEESADDTIVVAVEIDPRLERPADALAAGVSREVAGACGFAPGRVMILPRGGIPITANGKIRHVRLRDVLLEGALG